MTEEASNEQMKRWADAALEWGKANATFAEASAKYAEVTREAAEMVPTGREADELREFASDLDKWAGNARHDALGSGAAAALLRTAKWNPDFQSDD